MHLIFCSQCHDRSKLEGTTSARVVARVHFCIIDTPIFWAGGGGCDGGYSPLSLPPPLQNQLGYMFTSCGVK